MSSSTFFLLLAVAIVGVLIFVAITLTQKRPHRFDKEKYQVAFLAIENSLTRDNPDSFQLSIVRADKLLDQALIELGFSGKTMGERLKRSGSRFSELNSVWYAHKLRNQIAHEPDIEISYPQAKKALAIFKQALKDLGAV